MIPSPCYNPELKEHCPDRTLGCAKTCPKWAEYVKKRNAIYDERKYKSAAYELTTERRKRHYLKHVILGRNRKRK